MASTDGGGDGRLEPDADGYADDSHRSGELILQLVEALQKENRFSLNNFSALLQQLLQRPLPRWFEALLRNVDLRRITDNNRWRYCSRGRSSPQAGQVFFSCAHCDGTAVFPQKVNASFRAVCKKLRLHLSECPGLTEDERDVLGAGSLREVTGIEHPWTALLQAVFDEQQSGLGPIVSFPSSFNISIPSPARGVLIRCMSIPRCDPTDPLASFGVKVQSCQDHVTISEKYPTPDLMNLLYPRHAPLLREGMLMEGDIVVAVNGELLYDVKGEKALVPREHVIACMRATTGAYLRIGLWRLGTSGEKRKENVAESIGAAREEIIRISLALGIDAALFGGSENDGRGANRGSSGIGQKDELATMESTLEELRSSAATAKADLTECQTKLLQAHGALGTELEEEWRDVSTVLTQERRGAFHERVAQMEQEVALRTATIAGLLEGCQNLIRELGVDAARSPLDRQIMASLARDTVTDEIVMTSTVASEDCTGISARAFADLTARIAELNEEKRCRTLERMEKHGMCLLQSKGSLILKLLRQHDDAWVFDSPVDAEFWGVPTYYDRKEIIYCEFIESRTKFLDYWGDNYLQFDTLFRAKHSTLVLVYSLINNCGGINKK